MLLAAPLLSCGGGSQDTLRLSGIAARTPAQASASHDRGARVRHATPGDVAAPRPDDALAAQLGGERAAASSLDERFPLHGVAVHMLAQVFAEPRFDAEVLGYLRRGARVRAAPFGSGSDGPGCPRRFHELSTGGCVCDGQGFLFGREPQSFEPSPPPPSLHDALPYSYAKASSATLQYWRAPTASEERDALAQLAASPELTTLAARVPNATAALALPDYLRMAMEPGFYVSVDREEQVASDASPWPVEAAPSIDAAPSTARPEGDVVRGFMRTVRGGYVPSASLTAVVPPSGLGVVLGDGLSLPLGIVHRGSAKAWRPDPLGGAPQAVDALPHAAVVPLAQASSNSDPSRVLARSGLMVARSALRIATQVVRPALVPRRARLIHVRLAEQTLVAYEGERPVFATLVTTGKAGFETPTGIFRIYAKHVSTTMDGTAPRSPAATAEPPALPSVEPEEDEAYSIEDVAWTMYFSGNYALHAAFWHDRFGGVRSHGCVNLPPADAHWLFRWATPVLPAEWHGVQATRDNPGTWVFIE